jgi:uncharacterized membrane protein YcaP (DUF421 family)
MRAFDSIRWNDVLVPTVPLIEIFLRGTAVYLGLFLMLRVVLKREAGTVGITDLLVVVLIADAAQNAMAAEYKSVPEGLLLVGTIIFWSYALDWIAYRSPLLRHWINPPPLPLIQEGRLNRKNLRKELITVEELESQLREQGIEDIASVKTAYMEGDGRISAIKFDGEQHGKRKSSGM